MLQNYLILHDYLLCLVFVSMTSDIIVTYSACRTLRINKFSWRGNILIGNGFPVMEWLLVVACPARTRRCHLIGILYLLYQ